MKLKLLGLAASVLILSGCSYFQGAQEWASGAAQSAQEWASGAAEYLPTWLTPYRPDIHQGNIITKEMVDNLHEGMTKNQVIFLLGTPALKSIFHQEEWDYIYFFDPRSGDESIRKLVVYFDEDGRVDRIESDKMPDETEADLIILGERARLETLEKQNAAKEEKNKVEESSQAIPLTGDKEEKASTTEEAKTNE